MSRPFAAFDIDGTLIRWQLFHAVVDELARQGLLDTTQAKVARRTWKERVPGASFNDYEIAMVKTYEAALTQLPIEDVDRAIDQVLAEYKDQSYSYTSNLITKLKAQNYLIFAVSGSQDEIVRKLAAHYGFDDSCGTLYEVENGVYTGNTTVVKSTNKPIYLRKLIEKHGANWKGSYGIGDSESDIPMLSIVENPIAFNPTQALYEHARTARWNIVVERKNTIFELTPNGDTYRLA